MGDKLTLSDYITKPLPKLVDHPDFSQHAMRVATALADITTEKLEEIDITQFNRGDKK